MIVARMPVPKVTDLRVGQRIVLGEDPGSLTLCRLVGWAWQDDCDPPPGREGEGWLGGWAWLEAHLEPIASVTVVEDELEEPEADDRPRLVN